MTKQTGGGNPAPSADSLAKAARRAVNKGPAPVHLWSPPFCGEIDIRIRRDGTWDYLGTPIARVELLKLFASILKREGDAFFLVTPVEKVRIRVDDAPFVAVDVEAQGAGAAQALTFTTNLGDSVVAGPEHPIRVERSADTGEPAPYVELRDGLEALIDRKSFLRLVELGGDALHQGKRWFGLWSRGVFFPVIPSDELAG
ncbi:MAG: proteophosphoglycan precursor [Rhodobacterales bacterium CG2_30_65_12]|nr:MAG: proteophosphoglycan precursor [Rhodobacterales bacterium CG2_30_65_12]